MVTGFLQFHCRATEHSVDRTGPSAAGVIPAFQHFAESTLVVPDAQLQPEVLILVRRYPFSIGLETLVCTSGFLPVSL